MLRKAKALGLAAFVLSPACFAGFYGGLSAGPEGASFTQKAYVARPGTATTGGFNVIDKNHFAGIGVFGSIFAGYSRNFCDVYNLAAEINANISSLEYRLANAEYVHSNFSKTTFKITNSEGISIMPGYNLSESTTFYARLGYINGRLKIAEPDPTIQSLRRNVNGFRYGLGIRHAVTPKLALMMDYSQINYGAVHSNVYESFGNVFKHTDIRPNTAQVGFGFLYCFDHPAPKPYEK